MELYEQMRREYEFGTGTIIGVARKLAVHRRMVREAIHSAVPVRRKKMERPSIKMAPVTAFIEAILESDRKAPRKQRHTAMRIYNRIRAEVPACTAAERTVRQYVGRRKHALGLTQHETLCRRATTGVSRRRWIGTKRTPISAANASSCKCSRCVRWPAQHLPRLIRS